MDKNQSKGVWRTNPRFVPLVDECSPGPAYMPQENLRSKPGPKFAAGPRPEEAPKKKVKMSNQASSNTQNLPKVTVGGGHNSRSSTAMGERSGSRATSPSNYVRKEKNISPSFNSEGYKSAVSTTLLQNRSKGPNCTFGGRTPLPGPTDTPGFITHPSLLESLPSYKGRWRTASPNEVDEESKKAERHKHAELMKILRKGANRSMEFHSTTPSYTMGCKRKIGGSTTPGPGDYKIEKYSPKNQIDAPTMARAPLNTLHGAKGLDSPGPALYSHHRRI